MIDFEGVGSLPNILENGFDTYPWERGRIEPTLPTPITLSRSYPIDQPMVIERYIAPLSRRHSSVRVWQPFS